MQWSWAWVIVLVGGAVAQGRPGNWVIREGKFWVDGQWVFLKTAKTLRNFADAREVGELIGDLDVLKGKHFNCIEINCYWYQFDHGGEGRIDVSTEPLRQLVDAIYAKGMYPCISVETYGVGGGRLPAAFWAKHPEAVAIDALGKEVRDDEYGFGGPVPSIFNAAYLEASRRFIRAVTEAVDCSKVLYFETTVEPQLMGNHALEFSAAGRGAYEAWLAKGNVGPAWPGRFPVEEEFVSSEGYRRFKAEALAAWVNGDAAAVREVAGKDAYVAVDYLETGGKEMGNRNGDSVEFLRRLTSANVIQVNWSWVLERHEPNAVAYENLKKVMRATKRDWAITEHMTLNGSDYPASEVPAMLRNTLKNGTQFGWEFVNVRADGARFSLYGPGWAAKPVMAVVDDGWEGWMREVREAAGGR